MTVTRVHPLDRPLAGTAPVPGDKSISHRVAILASLARGESRVSGFSPAGDCESTLAVLRGLGVPIERDRDRVHVRGRGAEGFRAPEAPLDCGRSGTTMRLMAGVLAGAGVPAALTGHPQLLARPMRRVAEPLRLMGATVDLQPDGTPPLRIGAEGRLRGVTYRLPVASAQVKSALLLAGLGAEGRTMVVEEIPTRDHTERLLRAMGAAVVTAEGPEGLEVSVEPGELDAIDVDVPGDPSSAAFLAAAAALVPGSDVVARDIGLNPGRTGFLRALASMGALLEVAERPDGGPEPAGDVRVRHAPLRPITVEAAEVPGMVDELPLVALLATQAEGLTEVRGAGELRVKESDRIGGVVAGLRALGATAEELHDGFVVEGPTALHGGRCDARTDHRLAMTFTLAGLIASGPVEVDGMAFVDDSFPGFLETLKALR